MTDHEEAIISACCNNLAQLRNVAEKKPDIVAVVLDSIEPVKVLSSIFQRLGFMSKNF